MPETVALDRDALYYPYIQIRDVNWLKSTLLCFPSVHRIVPFGDFRSTVASVPGDSPEVEQFCRTIGTRGPLLQPSDLVWAHAATLELCRKFEANKAELAERSFFLKYSVHYTSADDLFTLHGGKISDSLLRYLVNKGLAGTGRGGIYGEWVTVHRKVGEVIMSTIALAIADHYGLDIVTPSDEAHYLTCFSDEDHIFAHLLQDGPSLSTAPSREDLTDDLAQVVMTTLFDVERLTAEQIAELHKEGKDLGRFKNAVAAVAAHIPNISDPEKRWKRLHEAAGEVIEEWNAYKRTLPRFAFDALIDASNIKPPEWGTALLAGASAHHVLGIGAGLFIAVLTYSGVKIWRSYRENKNSPYRYLTCIYNKGATLKAPTVLSERIQQVLPL